jgi:hypothetical protein
MVEWVSETVVADVFVSCKFKADVNVFVTGTEGTNKYARPTSEITHIKISTVSFLVLSVR